MKTIGIAFLFVVVSFVSVACGGGAASVSGVDQAKPITELDAGEISTFCSWAIDVQGGPGHVTECGPDVTVEAPTQDECEAGYAQIPAGCSGVTVEEMEACVNAIADDPCAESIPECNEYFSCLFG
jgi:hypothetical protein